MKLYHLSESNLDGKILKPRIPDNYMTNNGYEENKTPRISFSSSIEGCLIGISANLKGKTLFVHIIDESYSNPEIKTISNKEVPDQSLTKEVWVLNDVKLKFVKKIKITDSKDTPLTYKYGNTTAETYEWNYISESTVLKSNTSGNLTISKDEISYNFNKWSKTKGNNILFITGLSGSGKSTRALELSKKRHALVIALDNFEHAADGNCKYSSEFISLNPKYKSFSDKHWVDVDYETFYDVANEYFEWLIKKLRTQSTNLFIIEGVQLYTCMDTASEKYVKDQPLIVKITSPEECDKRIDKRGNDTVFGRHDLEQLKQNYGYLQGFIRRMGIEYNLSQSVNEKSDKMQKGFMQDGHFNAVKIINGKPYRDSVEVLIIKDDRVFLFENNGKYRVPGGSKEQGISDIDQVKIEAGEETGMEITNIRYLTSFTKVPHSPSYIKPFVIDGKKYDNYYGKNIDLYIADYSGKSKLLPDNDFDIDMRKHGTFYEIKEIISKVEPEYAIHLTNISESYDPPMSTSEIKKNYPDKAEYLLKDPIHKWRAENGIELIHEEPSLEEQERIWKNWQLMPDILKKKSDKKCIELTGMTNSQLHIKIMSEKWGNNMNESVLINKPNIAYRFDDWLNGNDNILFIFGFGGSGKSTTAQLMAKEFDAEHIEIDALIGYLRTIHGENEVKFSKNPEKTTTIIMDYIEEKALNRKVIVEGAQLPKMDFEKIKIHPIIMINTSLVVSSIRAIKRAYLPENRAKYSGASKLYVPKYNIKNYNKFEEFKKNIDDYNNGNKTTLTESSLIGKEVYLAKENKKTKITEVDGDGDACYDSNGMIDSCDNIYSCNACGILRLGHERNKTCICGEKKGCSPIQEACKDLKTARKFVTDVQKIAKKYNANFFMVTDGASGYSNGNGSVDDAVRNARLKQIEWEKNNGFDPDEDWAKDASNTSKHNVQESTITEGILDVFKNEERERYDRVRSITSSKLDETESVIKSYKSKGETVDYRTGEPRINELHQVFSDFKWYEVNSDKVSAKFKKDIDLSYKTYHARVYSLFEMSKHVDPKGYRYTLDGIAEYGAQHTVVSAVPYDMKEIKDEVDTLYKELDHLLSGKYSKFKKQGSIIVEPKTDIKKDYTKFEDGTSNDIVIGYWNLWKFDPNARANFNTDEHNQFWNVLQDINTVLNSKIKNKDLVSVSSDGDDWDEGFIRVNILVNSKESTIVESTNIDQSDKDAIDNFIKSDKYLDKVGPILTKYKDLKIRDIVPNPFKTFDFVRRMPGYNISIYKNRIIFKSKTDPTDIRVGTVYVHISGSPAISIAKVSNDYFKESMMVESAILEKVMFNHIETFISRPDLMFKNNIELYHGTSRKLDALSPISRNLGTRLSNPRQSVFLTDNKAYSLFAGIITLMYDTFDQIEKQTGISIDNRRKLWTMNVKEQVLYIDNTFNSSQFTNKISKESIYIYCFNLDPKELGRGHVPKEYTIDKEIIPSSTEIVSYAQFSKNIKFVDGSTFEELKNKRDKDYDEELSFIDRLLYPSKQERKAKDLIYKNLYESVTILEGLTAEERNNLPDSAFGLPHDRKFPLTDKTHVNSAIAYFRTVKDEKDQKLLADNIIKRYKELGMDNKINKSNPLYYHILKEMRHESYIGGIIGDAMQRYADKLGELLRNPIPQTRFIKEEFYSPGSEPAANRANTLRIKSEEANRDPAPSRYNLNLLSYHLSAGILPDPTDLWYKNLVKVLPNQVKDTFASYKIPVVPIEESVITESYTGRMEGYCGRYAWQAKDDLEPPHLFGTYLTLDSDGRTYRGQALPFEDDEIMKKLDPNLSANCEIFITTSDCGEGLIDKEFRIRSFKSIKKNEYLVLDMKSKEIPEIKELLELDSDATNKFLTEEQIMESSGLNNEFDTIFLNSTFNDDSFKKDLMLLCIRFNEANAIEKRAIYFKTISPFCDDTLANDLSIVDLEYLRRISVIMKQELDKDSIIDLRLFSVSGLKNRIVDTISEATVSFAGKDLVPVYIVLTNTGSLMAKAIKLYTKEPFNHASLSFEPDLKRLYSFGLSDDDTPGFALESKDGGYLRRFDDVDMEMHVVFVQKWQADIMKKRLDDLLMMDKKMQYSFIGLLSFVFNKPIVRTTKMFCSEFVDSVFKLAKMDITGKPSQLVTPYDLAKSNQANVFMLYNGSMKQFDSTQADKLVKSLQRKHITVMEKVSNIDLNVSSYIEMLLENSTDYDTLCAIYEASKNILNGELLAENNRLIGPYFDIKSILEVKEFPVQFTEDGDLLIKKMSKMNYDEEYYNAHRLLISYEKTDNIEGMKYELAKLKFINTLLEDKIYDENTKEDDKARYIKTRAKVLNDFNKYLTIISHKEKDFNFTEYYNSTPFSDATIKIKKSTIDQSILLFKKLVKPY